MCEHLLFGHCPLTAETERSHAVMFSTVTFGKTDETFYITHHWFWQWAQVSTRGKSKIYNDKDEYNKQNDIHNLTFQLWCITTLQ